ncbi:unnamed protein product [Dibothriocephalus latus]|uniref:Uncharacterized protein n=1 Tax=Dibothriocephalus latus TaxID=60516 RepID=A0A3P7L9P2_DIBLA|nr:unnamed protein product [Dibothriocephalus latus]
MRAVGTSPAVQCASPRPPAYSLSQTGTINGSTTSIVYHSTASVESPSPQQGRATYLTMQGKTDCLMPLIKPETGVCRQQSQPHSGVGMEDNLAASQQLQGQVLQQQQQQPQHPQQQQHIIVQTQQNPLQQHTVLQQGEFHSFTSSLSHSVVQAGQAVLCVQGCSAFCNLHHTNWAHWGC